MTAAAWPVDASPLRDHTIGMPIAFAPRNACPTLAMPMRTGDGFLARLPPLLAPLQPRQFEGIAGAALANGNGLVEITRRGNLQIRGLAEDGGPALADSLAALGLELPGGPPISADALLAANEVDHARVLAGTIAAELETSGIGDRLAPKVTLVLDFGSRFAPDGLVADLRLAIRAERAFLGLGGDAAGARWLGSVPTGAAVPAVLRWLDVLAGLGPRARLTHAETRANPAFDAATTDLPGFAPGIPAAANGSRGPEAAEIVFPFGQAVAGRLAALASRAEEAGIEAIAPAPDRRLLFAGPADARAAILDAAASLGFVTRSDDPRRSVFACAGSAGCASGHLPTRELADAIAGAAPDLLDGSLVHISGCAKGCAHPDPAAITLVAIDNGLQVVLEGRPRDEAAGIVPANDVAARLAALDAAIRRDRQGTERAATVLQRLGRDRIAAILRDGTAKEEHGSERSAGRESRLPA